MWRTMCRKNKAALDNSKSKWTAKPKTWKQGPPSLFFFFFLFGWQSACWWVNDPRPVCLHRSLFAAPDQCITFGNLRFPAAIASCWICVFWQCLREEHSVRCQVKTVCDRFGGEKSREDKQAAKCLRNVSALRQKAISAVDVDMTG